MKPYFKNHIDPKNIKVASYQKGLLLYDVVDPSLHFLAKLDDLFALPYSVYLLNADGATIKINPFGAQICGFQTPEQAVSKTIFDVSTGNTSNVLLENCKSVLIQESLKIFDEVNMRMDGRTLQFLSIKFPCYDHSFQLQGTFGISIVLGENSLAEAISRLTEMGLLPKHTNAQEQVIQLNLGGINLTPREKECLEYTVKGFTAKEIARKLLISPRTVEEYINQLKLKFGVASKQQMIQKILDV